MTIIDITIISHITNDSQLFSCFVFKNIVFKISDSRLFAFENYYMLHIVQFKGNLTHADRAHATC